MCHLTITKLYNFFKITKLIACYCCFISDFYLYQKHIERKMTFSVSFFQAEFRRKKALYFWKSKLQNFLPLPVMVADRTFRCIPIDCLEFEMIQNDSKCYFQHWGAQSWFGLVNQVVWAHPINEIMQSFRKFIKPNSKFLWTAELQKLFNDTKALIISKV